LLLGPGDNLRLGCKVGGRLRGRLLAGFGLGGDRYRPQQDRGHDRHHHRDRGAERDGQLHPPDERLPGRVQQRDAESLGQPRGDADGAAQGVARDRGGVAGDARREGPGQLAAVDGHADAAKDGDPERAAELRAGL
jgi:hypothetical protein